MNTPNHHNAPDAVHPQLGPKGSSHTGQIPPRLVGGTSGVALHDWQLEDVPSVRGMQGSDGAHVHSDILILQQDISHLRARYLEADQEIRRLRSIEWDRTHYTQHMRWFSSRAMLACIAALCAGSYFDEAWVSPIAWPALLVFLTIWLTA